MDPIKVDFTGKSKGGVKKPKNAVLKLIISIIGTIIGGAITYYFMLPPLNFKSLDFYIFIGAILAMFIVLSLVTSGMITSPDYTPYAKRLSVVPIIIALVVALVMGVCYLVSCVFFRADSYSKIIEVDESKTFAGDIAEVDFQSVPVLDTNAAAAVAMRTLGELPDLVSQFEVGIDYTQINYKGNPVKVTTLSYGDIFKWLKNTKTGLPGYVVVNMVTKKAELVRTDAAGLGYGNIRYSIYEHFNKYVLRHVRFAFPTYLLGTPTFELDEAGRPFWFVPIEDKTIGVFGGTDVIGLIKVDAIDGSMTEYSIDDVKDNEELQWIDGVFSAKLLVQQYNYHGKYSGGFWNSIIGQTGVKVATEGSNYLAIDDDVYMYTGVTSTGQDQSIIGFVLVNMRTKEANFYQVSGAKEYSAASSAKGAVQNFGYDATFPILLNISGQPTYFISLIDSAYLVKMYAMVNVTNYQVVVTGNTIAGCLEQYVAQLHESDIDVDVDIDSIKDDIEAITQSGEEPTEPSDTPDVTEPTDEPDENLTVWTGKVTDIRTAVIDGDSWYYIAIDSSASYFAIKADKAEKVIILNVGDSVTFRTKNAEGAIINISSFD